MLTPELIAAAAVGAIIIVGAIGQYFKSLRTPPPPSSPSSSTLHAIGMEFGNRQQMDDLVRAVDRVADAIENKKTAGIETRFDRLLERLDDLEGRPRRRD